MRATDTAEIGRTGLHVTRLGLGGVARSGASPATDPHIPSPESEAVSLIRRRLGLELNYLDTAPMYGVGHSERRCGPVLDLFARASAAGCSPPRDRTGVSDRPCACCSGSAILNMTTRQCGPRSEIERLSSARCQEAVMKWTLTIKEQTFGVHTDVNKYECRVTRTGRDVRLSVQNLSAGPLREGRFWMPASVARHLGNALLLACSEEGDRTNIVFSIDEGKGKK